MDFQLTPEQELIRASAREFAEHEIAPYAREWDRAEEIDRSLVAKLADAGYLGAGWDEEYGGSGLVPLPAIHARFWPAITRRERPPSPLHRPPACAAEECDLSLGARDPEARQHYWQGHLTPCRTRSSSRSSAGRTRPSGESSPSTTVSSTRRSRASG